MAQTGYTPISIYYSATASNTPSAGNLVAGELAINTADGKLFYKDSAGTVQVIGTKGGVGSSTTTQVLYNNAGTVAGSANFIFDGTRVGITNSSPRRNLEVGGTIAAPTALATAISTSASGTVVIADTGTTVGTVVGTALNGSSYDTYIQARNMGAASTPYNLLLQPLGGSVGIGTNSPTDGKLVISGNSVTTAQGIRLVGDTADARFICESATLGAGILGTFSAHAQLFYTNSTERMRISSSGSVGIGVSSPANTLQISSGSAAEFDMLVSGTRTGTLYTDNSQMLVVAVTAIPMIFRTSDTERMRIDSSGNVLINTTSSFDGNLCVVGNTGADVVGVKSVGGASAVPLVSWNSATTGNNVFVGFYTEASLTSRGNITYNRIGGLVSYNTTSDQRLKENITDAGSALEKIGSVKIRSFDWKETGNHTDFGVIAQELITVAPEAVTAGDEEAEIKQTWGVDTSALVPAMIKAIQELNAKVDAQAVEIANLKAK